MTKRQTEEIAKFCLDISKLSLGSFVFALISPEISLGRVVAAIFGLVVSGIFFTIGIRLFRKIK